jgi:predicted secreted protein
MGRRLPSLCTLLAVALFAGAARSAEEDRDERDRVTFDVMRTAHVQNDRLTELLVVSDEDVDAAALADRVNRTMAWALQQARSVPQVKQRTGGYETRQSVNPRTKEERWTARQELILSTGDPEALRGLVAKLQSRLQLSSIGYSASEQSRTRVEDSTIERALQAFRERAELIRKSLGFASYHIVEIHVATGTWDPARRRRYAGQLAVAAETVGGVAPPALEGGTSEVTASVNGTIQLK